MYKKLIVITTKFPYFNTEAFLESEYPFLQKAFDEVTFLPLIKGICREQCQNATICDAYANLYSHKFPFMYKVVSSKNYYSSLWKHRTKIFEKHRIANTFKQEVHYQIFKKLVSANFSLFDDKTIVYSYWFNAPVYALLKLKEECGLKYKVVCRAHRFDVYDENGEMPNRAFCIRAIDKVFPISQDAIDTFTTKYGYAEKYFLSRLGVKDFGRIATRSGNDSFHVLSVSQVHPRKRIREIFESVQEFAKNNSTIDIIWTHFGDGTQFNELSHWANNHNIPNLSVEIKGRVPNTEILTYIANTPLDVFVNLSVSEGVPVSIMEAQSFGLPVIATDVGGTKEIVNDNNGILLPPTPSIEEVVDALESVMDKCFDRKLIKESWKSISNADTNFQTFVENLRKI